MHVTGNATGLSEWIEQLDETAGAGRLFLVTGATSSGSNQEPHGLLALDVQRLDAVHDLLLVSDERHAELDDVLQCQLRRVVNGQDAGAGELVRVAVHLDAGQPVGGRLRHGRSVIGVVASQQQTRTLRPDDTNMQQLQLRISLGRRQLESPHLRSH